MGDSSAPKFVRSLVYHAAWMFAELGYRALAVDLDPQSNLSIMAVDDDRFEDLWPETGVSKTIFGAVKPLFEGTGDVREAHLEGLSKGLLNLLVGDLALSGIEDDLSIEWPRCLEGKDRAFRVTSAFWRVIKDAAERASAEVVLINVGPNLGSINRAALVASDYVVIPVTSDLFSLQGLKNLGPALLNWRSTWEKAKGNANLELGIQPNGRMEPIGYVSMQHVERLYRPVKAYAKWQSRMPEAYRSSVLREQIEAPLNGVDPFQLGVIKHFRSLMPMAMEARKPMFKLKAADGAIGAHQASVQQCFDDFQRLVTEIIARTGIELNH